MGFVLKHFCTRTETHFVVNIDLFKLIDVFVVKKQNKQQTTTNKQQRNGDVESNVNHQFQVGQLLFLPPPPPKHILSLIR